MSDIHLKWAMYLIQVHDRKIKHNLIQFNLILTRAATDQRKKRIVWNIKKSKVPEYQLAYLKFMTSVCEQ